MDRFDTVVIGAGPTGLAVAYELQGRTLALRLIPRKCCKRPSGIAMWWSFC